MEQALPLITKIQVQKRPYLYLDRHPLETETQLSLHFAP